MKKYLKIWLKYSLVSAQVAFDSRFAAITFIFGKLIRFLIFFLFLLVLAQKTKMIAGYSLWQIIFFYLTFNLVDTLAQLFLREVYNFRWYVSTGNFDYILIKPFSPLFKSLFGGTDILDLPTLVILIVFIIFALPNLGVISGLGFFLYLLLIINGFLIALSFHIIVLSFGVLATEIDNMIMFYRDLTQMGRFPVDIYRQPLQGILTFVIPVGIMMTFPAKALIGLLSVQGVIFSLLIGAFFLLFSFLFWQFALKRYSSASS